MRIQTTRPQQGKARRRSTELMMGTALGGALMVLGAASPAAADDECGAPVGTNPAVVTCTVAGGPYTSGIAYTAGQSLQIILDSGVTVDGGVQVTSTAGYANLFGSMVDVTRSDGGLAVGVNSTSLVDVALRDVTSTGGQGIVAAAATTAIVRARDVTTDTVGLSVTGTTSATALVETVTVTSDGSTPGAGIAVTAASNGFATVRSLTAATPLEVTATGDDLVGIQAAGGTISITGVGSVTTNGQGSSGVVADATGGAEITVDVVETHGGSSHGIDVVGDGGQAVIVTNTSVHTRGDGSEGIMAKTNAGYVSVTTDRVHTEGDDAIGIRAITGLAAGPSEIEVIVHSSIVTEGDDSRGVYADSRNGPITLDLGSVTTGTVGGARGQNSHGIDAFVQGGELTIDVVSVTTHGVGAQGIDVYGEAGADVAVDRVITHGDDATAVEVTGGLITITNTSVTTHGDRSKGIVANGTGENITITVTEGVSTGDPGVAGRGEDATAIQAELSGGDDQDKLVINVGTETVGGVITTHGANARGVDATNHNGDATLNMALGEITTQGADADGVHIQAGGAATATIGKVATRGNRASGVLVWGSSADVTVGEVTAAGNNLTAVSVAGTSGDAELEFGTVTTTGEEASGVSMYAADGQALKVTGGLITTSGRNSIGLVATGGDQQITLTGDIETAGFGASGVLIERADKIDLAVRNITTTGDQARGVNIVIDPEDQAGIDVDVTVGDVRTGSVRPDGARQGRYSDGVFVWNTGSTTITANSVTTQGHQSDGVLVDGTNELGEAAGTANVTVNGAVTTADGNGVYLQNVAGGSVTVGGAISTRGNSHAGVRIAAGGPGAVTVDVKDITTTGDDAHGVSVAALGNVTIKTGDISTGERPENQTFTGFRARGVTASTQGDSTLSIATGDITTRMTGGHGVSAGTQTGLLTISAQNITTDGRETHGISTHTEGGNATIRAWDIDVGNAEAAANDRSKAVNVAMSGGGMLDMAVGNISVNGRGAAGVDIEAAGNSLVRVGDMSIHGLGANGLIFDGHAAGTLDLWVGDIDVHGDDSNGVLIMDSARTAISTGSIHTRGALSHGVQLNSQGRPDVTIGDVTITTRENETITTEGDGSHGVFIEGATLADDARVVLNLQDILTRGAGSDAVLVQTHSAAGRVGVGARNIVTDGDSAAGVRVTGASHVDVKVNNIQTTGADAYGVHVASDDPLNSVIVTSTGLIDTAGDGAHGVYLEGETLASGRIMGVEMGGIRTRGDGADGVNMASYEDAAAVFIAANTIVTEGERSRGVAFTGGARHIEIDIGAVNTDGDGAVGVDISGGKWIEAEIGQVWTSGAEAHAVSIRAQADGQADVTVGSASASGDDAVAVNVEGRVANLTTTGEIVGRYAGVTLASMDGARLINRGSITSMGYAIEARGGAATITNEGEIFGRVALTENDDSIANRGGFHASGDSDFSGGHDVFNNTGLFTVSSRPGTPGSATFVNLERFNNGGTIDLADGVGGDHLTLQGTTLHGLDGGVIQMDLDLTGATPAADLLTVGALEGVNEIELHVQGRGAVGDTGVTLIASGAAQTGTEVEVTTIGGGFLDFNAVYDAASREFRVVAEAGVRPSSRPGSPRAPRPSGVAGRTWSRPVSTSCATAGPWACAGAVRPSSGPRASPVRKR